jgi:hypothetical protein
MEMVKSASPLWVLLLSLASRIEQPSWALGLSVGCPTTPLRTRTLFCNCPFFPFSRARHDVCGARHPFDLLTAASSLGTSAKSTRPPAARVSTEHLTAPARPVASGQVYEPGAGALGIRGNRLQPSRLCDVCQRQVCTPPTAPPAPPTAPTAVLLTLLVAACCRLSGWCCHTRCCTPRGLIAWTLSLCSLSWPQSAPPGYCRWRYDPFPLRAPPVARSWVRVLR